MCAENPEHGDNINHDRTCRRVKFPFTIPPSLVKHHDPHRAHNLFSAACSCSYPCCFSQIFAAPSSSANTLCPVLPIILAGPAREDLNLLSGARDSQSSSHSRVICAETYSATSDAEHEQSPFEHLSEGSRKHPSKSSAPVTPAGLPPALISSAPAVIARVLSATSRWPPRPLSRCRRGGTDIRPMAQPTLLHCGR